MVVLDTNILIEFSKGNEAIVRKIKQFESEGKLRTTVLNAEEFFFGIDQEDFDGALKVLAFLEVLPYSFDEVGKVVEVKKKLKGKGNYIGKYDEAIAGICLARGEKLLTLNKKHFRQVEGLELV